jgi:hypothetical protein
LFVLSLFLFSLSLSSTLFCITVEAAESR